MARRAPALERLAQLPEAERKVGPFTLVEQLGRGGYAPVWLAKEVYGQTELRTVALKLFVVESPTSSAAPGDVAAREERVEHIVAEARTLSRVEHPNVVRFYTMATDESGCIFGLAMEYVRGQALNRRLAAEQRLSVTDTLAVAAAVSSALAAVHQVGVVHRDVKPANVVEALGVYKLIDFGIAAGTDGVRAPRAEKAPAEKRRVVVLDDVPLQLGHTNVSGLSDRLEWSGDASNGNPAVPTSGTIGYMDPGSLSSAGGASSDLYSLGAMLYECLTGMLPAAAAASAEGRQGLKAEVLDGRARPPSVATRAKVPPALARLVDALLSPDPAERPRSSELVAWEIESIRRSLEERSRPLPPEDTGPFRGLGRFETQDRDVYFGRAADTAVVVEALRSRGLVALVGASGSGKSSLARAAVVPAVQDGAIGGWPKEWDAVIVSPGERPRKAFLDALWKILPQMTLSAVPPSPEEVAGALAQRVQEKNRGVILVVDQLEEVVTLASGEERMWAVELLGILGEQPTLGVRALVTARQDLLNGILELGRVGRVLVRGAIFVAPLGAAGWDEVLERALSAYGYRFEDAALSTEIKEGVHTMAMPLAQFALSELWRRRDTKRKLIDRGGFQALGGLSGALERHAEATVKEIAKTPEALELLRQIMLHLTTPQGTRAACPRARLLDLGAGEAVEALLEGLEDARLVVRDGAGLTLAHEALLTQWSRLREWVRSAREDRIVVDEIESAAGKWGETHDETLLFRRRRLTGALEVQRRGTLPLSRVSSLFLRASRTAELRGRATLAAVALVIVGLGAVAVTVFVRNERAVAARAEAEMRRARAERSEEQTRAKGARATAALAQELAHERESCQVQLTALQSKLRSASEADLRKIQQSMNEPAAPDPPPRKVCRSARDMEMAAERSAWPVVASCKPDDPLCVCGVEAANPRP